MLFRQVKVLADSSRLRIFRRCFTAKNVIINAFSAMVHPKRLEQAALHDLSFLGREAHLARLDAGIWPAHPWLAPCLCSLTCFTYQQTQTQKVNNQTEYSNKQKAKNMWIWGHFRACRNTPAPSIPSHLHSSQLHRSDSGVQALKQHLKLLLT